MKSKGLLLSLVLASALIGAAAPLHAQFWAGDGRLRYPAGVKVASLGDSNGEFMNRFNPSGRALNIKPESIIENINARLGQRFKFWVWENGTTWGGANQSIGGYKTSDVLAQLPSFIPQALTANIKIVFVNVGTNDRTPNVAPTRQTQAAQIIQTLRNAGFVVIYNYIPSRDVVTDPAQGWVAGDPRWQDRIDFNTWLTATYVNDKNVYITTTNTALYLNPPTGQPQQVAPFMLKDDVHFAAPGAGLWANDSLYNAFNTIIPTGTWLPTYSSSQNYWANYNLTGTGGSITATCTIPASCVVSDSMLLEEPTGDATVQASKNGSDQQQLVFTPGAATGVSTFYFRPSSTAYLAAALALPASAYLIECFSYDQDNWVGFGNVGPILYNAAGGISYNSMIDVDQTTGGLQQAISFNPTCTPPMKRDVWASLRVRFYAEVYGGNHPATGVPITGTGTLTLKNSLYFQTDDSIAQFPLIRLDQ